MHTITTRFLSAYLSLSETAWRKVRILFYSIVISLVFTIAYACIAIAIDFPEVFYAMVTISVFFIALLMCFRLAVKHQLVARLFIISSWLTLCYLILNSGGVMSYVMPWLALMPVLGLLFLTLRDSIAWSIIGFITIVVFWLGESFLPIQTLFDVPPKAWIASLSIGLLLLLFIVVRIFEKQQLFLFYKVEKQNEDLRASAEEMRQNLEELRTTQEILAQREAESRSIIQALQTHFLVSEYDTRGKTLRANDKLLALLGMKKPSEIGKFTQELMAPSDWEKLGQNWPRILKGEAVNQEFHIKSKTKDFWLNYTFAPILDSTHQVYRVLSIGHEITKGKLHELEIKDINVKLQKSMLELEEQNKKLEEQRTRIENGKIRLEQYANDLMKLTRMPVLHSGELKSATQEILRRGAISMNTSRLSVWSYQTHDKSIVCECVFKQKENTFESGMVLRQRDFPMYFDAIKKEDMVIASDARESSSTNEFKSAYLIPQNIFSMLDVPLVFEGKFYGILCCEHEGNIREWDAEDITFAKSVADIIVLALSASKRKENEGMIVEQNKMIQIQNEELIKYSEEIKVINQSLEERVLERTEALEKQNMKLSEYAFVNAHLLRGPLCRILGLVNLLEYNRTGNDTQQVFEYLHKSTQELDGVVKKITSLLDEGVYFDRNEFGETSN